MEDKQIQTEKEQTQVQNSEQPQVSTQGENQEQVTESAVPGKKKKRLFDLLLIFGLLLIIGAGGALIWLEVNNEKANDIYDDLKDQFVSTFPNQTESVGSDDTTEEMGSTTEGPSEELSTDSPETNEGSTEEIDPSTDESADGSTEESVDGTNEETSESLPEEDSTEESIQGSTESATEESTEGATDDTPWYQMISVDFAGLQEINPDIIGWIFFENDDISYPVLYSEGTSDYLRKNIYGEFSTVGSIYLDGSNNRGFEDRHTVLYGHNRYDLSMFGKLKYYVQFRVYYPDHQYFQILEDGVVHRYRIFSYCHVSETETSLVNVSFDENDDAQFEALIREFENRSTYGKNDVEVTVDDHVMTLVTCFTEGRRVLVNAVRVDSYTYE